MPVSCGKGVLEVMTAGRERPIARIRAGRGAYLGRAGSAAQDGRPPGERAGRGGPDGMRRAVARCLGRGGERGGPDRLATGAGGGVRARMAARRLADAPGAAARMVPLAASGRGHLGPVGDAVPRGHAGYGGGGVEMAVARPGRRQVAEAGEQRGLQERQQRDEQQAAHPAHAAGVRRAATADGVAHALLPTALREGFPRKYARYAADGKRGDISARSGHSVVRMSP
ncbi:hypothetical protein B1H19_32420 [Streptomyces gilvosporeus]|uniref:Uncharacterized protein n=1 Tax=Streptomyces gilvosporeus TaxID=553510 RepID=A0A1V0TZP3_9ACTN|nr:hypothetical protein B1H19_32420 [Streptomyces gilvosporeus]